MSERVEKAMRMMLVAGLRYFARNADNEDEETHMDALADEIESGEASENQLIEAMEIISPDNF